MTVKIGTTEIAAKNASVRYEDSRYSVNITLVDNTTDIKVLDETLRAGFDGTVQFNNVSLSDLTFENISRNYSEDDTIMTSVFLRGDSTTA